MEEYDMDQGEDLWQRTTASERLLRQADAEGFVRLNAPRIRGAARRRGN